MEAFFLVGADIIRPLLQKLFGFRSVRELFCFF